MRYYVTGDTHGKVYDRFSEFLKDGENIEQLAFIILGDTGFNFYLNKTDAKEKQKCQDTGHIFYCVRGNHEERPENIKDMIIWYDSEIKNNVYLQSQYPNIRYLIDGSTYEFNGHSALVLGGAYSVDKWYRLQRAAGREWTGWFKDEQLTMNEMMNIEENCAKRSFDFVLSHTCPLDWMPTDLFLGSLNQSTVDNTMELWMQDFKDKIHWNIWLFGHFHDDRLVRPHVEMYYYNIEDLENIYSRWTSKDKELIRYLKKDPNYYIDGEER